MPGASWAWACGCCVRRRKGGGETGAGAGASGRAEEGDEWSLFIDLPVLEAATDGFSDDNLLGRGGFGPVYKAINPRFAPLHFPSLPVLGSGVLQDGQQIAVKKLSLRSRQGVQEFLNEVRLLLKVQHRNLVSLLGCCASSGQKMLVYPYFPNGSLDHILFSKNSSAFTNQLAFVMYCFGACSKLVVIMLYCCHSVSVYPSRSHALLFVQIPSVMDCSGYMAPEYAMNGYLSTKTDVFSFGILVLEIVSGRKNMVRHEDDEKTDLLNHTWKLFEEGRSLEIVDPSLSDADAEQTLLCIQLGLLCCQAVVSDRPDMHSVQLILSSDSFTLPKPGKPAIHGRTGRWMTTTTASGSASTSATTGASNTKTNSTFGTDTNTNTNTMRGSVLANIDEDESRNSISISFTTEGR
ncbi:hypothetical protein HU200_020823 [Digitaria exilis]|uniref:Protein kinase domain-containing protein n=1 Tax=Digitaria exilis TaxID=1010633 RepID=A0A835F0G0_9POAL|nr:hypothetical protein HU200_020823 [Digitaria exilis]